MLSKLKTNTALFFLFIFLLFSVVARGQKKDNSTSTVNVDSLFTEAQMALMIDGNKSDAAALFNKVLAVQPHNGVALSQLSRIFMSNEDTSKALKEIKKALKAEPANKDYLDQYASILFFSKEIPQSRKDF